MRKTEPLKILVVEDRLEDFHLMQNILSQQFSCDIHLATTKSEFQKELLDNKPDVIVSDSNIRSFDGFAALRLAGEESPNVPFVFCSGTGPATTPKDAAGHEVPWVSKDDGFAGLIAFIKAVLSKQEQ